MPPSRRRRVVHGLPRSPARSAGGLEVHRLEVHRGAVDGKALRGTRHHTCDGARPHPGEGGPGVRVLADLLGLQAAGRAQTAAGAGVDLPGLRHGRDLNAARNILFEGRRIVAAGRAEALNACGGTARPAA
jgi:hypothetical protein